MRCAELEKEEDIVIDGADEAARRTEEENIPRPNGRYEGGVGRRGDTD